MARKSTHNWISASRTKNSSSCSNNGWKTRFNSAKESTLNSNKSSSQRRIRRSLTKKKWKRCTALSFLRTRKTAEALNSTTKCKAAIMQTSTYKKMNMWRKRLRSPWMWKASANWQSKCSHSPIFNNNYLSRTEITGRGRRGVADLTPTTSSTRIPKTASRPRLIWTLKWRQKLSVKL